MEVIKTELESIQEAVDNTTEASNESIATYLGDRIPYHMCKDVLVKPLDPIKIKREFEVPVVKEKTQEEGETINEYEETKKEIREIDSNFAKGIVLKVPSAVEGIDWKFKVGDTVVYNKRFSVEFDIFRDSVLVKPYDIIAIED